MDTGRPSTSGSNGVMLNVASVIVALVWLAWFGPQLLLRIAAASSLLALLMIPISWIPPERLPAALLVLIPMASTLLSSRRGVATATVVGRGRLGRPVARALEAAGVRVNGPTGRGEFIMPADVVLLCVPDAEIAEVAASLNLTGVHVGHMSGATSIAGVDFGIHPLQTFVGDEGPEVFRGIGCAVEGRSPEALSVAQELARLLGARPFVISDHQRAGYHAAASLASNLVLSVLAAAEEMAASTLGDCPGSRPGMRRRGTRRADDRRSRTGARERCAPALARPRAPRAIGPSTAQPMPWKTAAGTLVADEGLQRVIPKSTPAIDLPRPTCEAERARQ